MIVAVAQSQIAQQLVFRRMGGIGRYFGQAFAVGCQGTAVVAHGLQQRTLQQESFSKRRKLLIELVQGFDCLDKIPLFGLLLRLFEQAARFGVGGHLYLGRQLAPGCFGGGQPQQTHHSEAQCPQH